MVEAVQEIMLAIRTRESKHCACELRSFVAGKQAGIGTGRRHPSGRGSVRRNYLEDAQPAGPMISALCRDRAGGRAAFRKALYFGLAHIVFRKPVREPARERAPHVSEPGITLCLSSRLCLLSRPPAADAVHLAGSLNALGSVSGHEPVSPSRVSGRVSPWWH